VPHLFRADQARGTGLLPAWRTGSHDLLQRAIQLNAAPQKDHLQGPHRSTLLLSIYGPMAARSNRRVSGMSQFHEARSHETVRQCAKGDGVGVEDRYRLDRRERRQSSARRADARRRLIAHHPSRMGPVDSFPTPGGIQGKPRQAWYSVTQGSPDCVFSSVGLGRPPAQRSAWADVADQRSYPEGMRILFVRPTA
jgi:hypothetical protein